MGCGGGGGGGGGDEDMAGVADALAMPRPCNLPMMMVTGGGDCKVGSDCKDGGDCKVGDDSAAEALPKFR